MYESPINISLLPILSQFEGEVLKTVQKMDINVDKDELAKALKYDRNQYDKGYTNGYNNGIQEYVKMLKEAICEENEIYRTCAKYMLAEDFQEGYEEKSDSIIRAIDKLAKEMLKGGEGK